MRYIFAVISRVCHCEAKPKQSLFPFKNITGHVWVIIIALFLFFPSFGFAEVKEIVSEGTYNMGDGETPGVAESRALLQAKRIALEQAGTYVESWTKGEKEKKQVGAKITDEERLFEARQWAEKGYQYDLNKEYDSAIEANTKAI